MSTTFKAVVILLVFASIASATLAISAFMGKEKEYMKRLLLEDKLAATLKEKMSLEKELNLTKTAKEELELKIAKTEDKVKEYIAQLEDSRQQNESVLMDLDAKKKELAKARLDLESERREKSNISGKLEDLQLNNERVKKEITALKNEKTALEKKIADLEETRSVNLDKIVVSSPDTETMPPQAQLPNQGPPVLKGKVIVVNKDYGFIVTDLGQANGIKKGMVFEVRDAKDSFGKIEIDKVYDTMSSATILPGGRINDMKKGNLIIESR